MTVSPKSGSSSGLAFMAGKVAERAIALSEPAGNWRLAGYSATSTGASARHCSMGSSKASAPSAWMRT